MSNKIGASLSFCLADLFQLLLAKRDPVLSPCGSCLKAQLARAGNLRFRAPHCVFALPLEQEFSRHKAKRLMTKTGRTVSL